MSDKLLNKSLIVYPLLFAIIMWIFVSFKAFLLFYGLFSLGMYLHITVTTLTNAFVGREINVKGDIFWKMLFLVIFCLTITLFVLI